MTVRETRVARVLSLALFAALALPGCRSAGYLTTSQLCCITKACVNDQRADRWEGDIGRCFGYWISQDGVSNKREIATEVGECRAWAERANYDPQKIDCGYLGGMGAVRAPATQGVAAPPCGPPEASPVDPLAVQVGLLPLPVESLWRVIDRVPFPNLEAALGAMDLPDAKLSYATRRRAWATLTLTDQDCANFRAAMARDGSYGRIDWMDCLCRGVVPTDAQVPVLRDGLVEALGDPDQDVRDLALAELQRLPDPSRPAAPAPSNGAIWNGLRTGTLRLG